MHPLIVFPTKTAHGTELAKRICDLALQCGYHAHIIDDPSQEKLNNACFTNQVIVFDATIEKNEQHIYHAATAQAMAFDQILVVSRTYLPINFPGLRQGGAPDYSNSFSNDDILRSLKVQLSDLTSTMPRKKLSLFSYIPAMSRSIAQHKEAMRKEGQIFISYRSHEIEGVQCLAEKIVNGEFYGKKNTVKYIRPGALVFENELLTAHRRWMLNVMLESFIAASEEVWVYQTEDYYQSWWTQGEIVHVLNMMGRNCPKIRIYDPKSGTLSEAPESMMVPLSIQQKKILARLESNANPDTMGPEAFAAMEMWRQIPGVGKMPYFNDKVFSDEFNCWPLFECNKCSKLYPQDFGQSIDVDGFLQCKSAHLFCLDPKKVIEIMNSPSRKLNCPGGCGAIYTLEEAAPRHLWYARRMGKPTGPDGKYITEMPCYRAIVSE